jgi:heavy metal translocating P-type ATPase
VPSHIRTVFHNFLLPILVFAGMLCYVLLSFLHISTLALFIILFAIVLGSYQLFIETLQSLLKKQFALDYIAILAIIVGIITREYFVTSVIALMIASGRTLEEYGASQAKKSLTNLIDRIPSDVLLWEKNAPGKKVNISEVTKEEEIYIRKGEVISLDGLLQTNAASIDESSLTGEPFGVDKFQGDLIRSGTVNLGQPIVLKVINEQKNSTYNKIIQMVQDAQEEKAPLVRLADRYSTYFTLITFFIAGCTLSYWHTLESVLAVLVIATPCPLIIATPIALLGGVNAAAKKRIIIKKLAVLEQLPKINTIVFDKTGTITLGKPKVDTIDFHSKRYTEKEVLTIASAIERSSLHPLAKAIVEYAEEKQITKEHAQNIEEIIGKGISAEINGKSFMLSRLETNGAAGMAIVLTEKGQDIATFHFIDEIREDSKTILTTLKNLGYNLYLFTGDKKLAADQLATSLGQAITVRAEMKPVDKQEGVSELQKQKKSVAMIGDGINDAPALAKANVGMVFSNAEQTAASEAADIVLLAGNFSLVQDTMQIGKRTIQIALQSILWGIGLSIGGMVLAAFGLIPPLLGAGIQEAIDVAVIINALRASR